MYTTSYRYDSFGRLLELVLPDTETVTYVYDAGGSLLSFAGEKSGTKVAYLNLVQTPRGQVLPFAFPKLAYVQMGGR